MAGLVGQEVDQGKWERRQRWWTDNLLHQICRYNRFMWRFFIGKIFCNIYKRYNLGKSGIQATLGLVSGNTSKFISTEREKLSHSIISKTSLIKLLNWVINRIILPWESVSPVSPYIQSKKLKFISTEWKNLSLCRNIQGKGKMMSGKVVIQK